MTNRLSVIFSVLLLLTFSYVCYLFVEYYEESDDLGWRKEALRNPYLALEIFSQEIGTEVLGVDSYLKLEPLEAYDTLLLASSGQIVSDKRLTEVLNWIDSGGHLIVAAECGTNDRLCDYFDVVTEETEYESSVFEDDFFDEFSNLESDANSEGEPGEGIDEARALEEKKARRKKRFIDGLRNYNEKLKDEGLLASSEEEVPYREQVLAYELSIAKEQLSSLVFGSVEGALRVEFDPALALSHPALTDDYWDKSQYDAIYSGGSEYGVHFMQLEKGAGLVTLMSDTLQFRSENIDKFDHAYLWQVLSGGEKAAIVYGSNMPSLGFMLWVFMPEMLIAFGVFVGLWIWYQVRRFGPVTVNNVRERRSSSEHISASAGFLWRGDWQADLLNPIRVDIRRQADKNLAGYESADENQRLEMLANESGLERSLVQDAMTLDDKFNEDSFYKIVRILQRIRECL
ncbi:DUF4350 domain-containing protein [Teredinibacter purpureus]|uniref:DUF4350 domain-containing protein n=1 Tax=Teredinibacter purpureus TaxID=2731756 RepID=UPI0005F7CBD6|nr:DUF4350 domain-containing protein [Teredinibacter purpureus]